MNTDRTLLLCECKDENCRGRRMVEYSQPIPADPWLRYELSVCPPCPLCGKEMMVVPMDPEYEDFVPVPARPDSIGATPILSRKILGTAANKVSSEAGQSISKAQVRDSSTESASTDKEQSTGNRIYTTDKLAVILRLSPKTVRVLIRKGLIRSLPGVRPYKVTQEALDEYLQTISVSDHLTDSPSTSVDSPEVHVGTHTSKHRTKKMRTSIHKTPRSDKDELQESIKDMDGWDD